MSHWDPNYVPPAEEGYQFYNRAFSNPSLIYNPGVPFGTVDYYSQFDQYTSSNYGNQYFQQNANQTGDIAQGNRVDNSHSYNSTFDLNIPHTITQQPVGMPTRAQESSNRKFQESQSYTSSDQYQNNQGYKSSDKSQSRSAYPNTYQSSNSHQMSNASNTHQVTNKQQRGNKNQERNKSQGKTVSQEFNSRNNETFGFDVGPDGSEGFDGKSYQVAHSNLHATAKEFQPYNALKSLNSRKNSGAIKKEQSYKKDGRQNNGRNQWGRDGADDGGQGIASWQDESQNKPSQDQNKLVQDQNKVMQDENKFMQDQNKFTQDQYKPMQEQYKQDYQQRGRFNQNVKTRQSDYTKGRGKQYKGYNENQYETAEGSEDGNSDKKFVRSYEREYPNRNSRNNFYRTKEQGEGNVRNGESYQRNYKGISNKRFTERNFNEGEWSGEAAQYTNREPGYDVEGVDNRNGDRVKEVVRYTENQRYMGRGYGERFTERDRYNEKESYSNKDRFKDQGRYTERDHYSERDRLSKSDRSRDKFNSNSRNSFRDRNLGVNNRDWANGTDRSRNNESENNLEVKDETSNDRKNKADKNSNDKMDNDRSNTGDKNRNNRGDNDRNNRGDSDRNNRGDNDRNNRGDKERNNVFNWDRNYKNNPRNGEKDKSYNRRNDREGYGYKKYETNRDETQDEFVEQHEMDRERRTNKDNWRNKNQYEKPVKKLANTQELKKKLDAASQRERLEEMVTRRLLECLVCCERLRYQDQIWSCKQCYHILHLRCVVEWAEASKLETGWRCPACQNINNEVPKEYRCYCDKMVQPPIEPGTVPHSCGNVCNRKARTCDHNCTLLCHPGPCPDCSLMVNKTCRCGSMTVLQTCSAMHELTCQNVCGKVLECGEHKCSKICHLKDCEPCGQFVRQECYCGKVGRKVPCTAEVRGEKFYECGETCGKLLRCGNHQCQKLCHAGACEDCDKDPQKVDTCPCGQTKLVEKRNSCLDPIPCCDKICNKPLKCGQPSSPHQCKHNCHEGPCPPCPMTTLVRCRCGHMDKEIACTELKSKADDARCGKKCTKKRQCCKHKCNQLCCIDVDHICPLPCNHLLTCGLHRCELTCHRGRCQPCWQTSFQELYCECGSSVLYPPVACGTRPPPCSQPCSRPRECGHEVNHACHTGTCPPCTVLTKKWCHGKHAQRSTIPCHQGEFSCGLPCGKEMPCKRHKCIQPCHSGPCPVPCTQPCVIPREECSHPCNAPCHEPPCPETPCKQVVKVSCQCGLRSSTRNCMDLAGEYQSIAMTQLASKMADIQRGQTVDITDLVSSQKKSATLKTLECNDECRIVERNRRLAIGLQIRNPDLSSKLMPRYSDYMKQWAKKDPHFCQTIHDKLTELVQLAKQSKQKSRSHSFNSMNRDKRHFVHEYCEHFGCESAAYDKEPNRNVIATAFRDKSWLPSLSLMEAIQRENGQRKVPGPVLSKSVAGKSETVSFKLPGRMVRPSTPPGEYVDYFNDPPP